MLGKANEAEFRYRISPHGGNWAAFCLKVLSLVRDSLGELILKINTLWSSWRNLPLTL